MTTENFQIDRELTVQLKLYYDLFVPETAAKPAPLLIAVHGYGGNKRAMMREARAVAPENFAVAALQGFHQHWREPDASSGKFKVGFAWLTSYKSEDSVAVHHQALRDLIENLIAEAIADRNNIFLFGFSQSCALNFRFALSNPTILRGIVGISGGIPSDLETSEIYQPTSAAALYLYGTRDEFYPLAQFDQNAAKLTNYAGDFRSQVYDAAHEITAEMREDARVFLAEKQKSSPRETP